MKNLFALVALVALGSLASCAGANYSEYSGFTQKGYKTEKVRENVYAVSFFGDGFDTKKKVYDYFIKRSSEVAKENSKSGFCILKEFPGEINNGGSNWPYYEGEIELKDKAVFDGIKCFGNT